MKFRKAGVVVTLALILSLLLGCQTKKQTLILATTTSTHDTGLLDEILPIFEKKYNATVKTIAVGTGEAIAMGQRGEADVLLVHSPKAEEQFVADGYGVNREDVMYNDFVLVGPAADPAGVRGMDASSALKQIASTKALFVSRGDDSGTHKKEKELWQKAGVQPPSDSYISTGQGMAETLRIADEKGAYTLADRGTYLSLKQSISLTILVEGDKVLFNPYGVIAVNPAKFPKVNYDLAVKFINWITSLETQQIIGNFGKEKYGQALFTPNSQEWRAKTGQ
ncbi:MAG: substrate-binding domain-containing protein [Chloroflexi bacterium]|nr:substrate-binding domain-containing protein [Chloroflexota bacterium]